MGASFGVKRFFTVLVFLDERGQKVWIGSQPHFRTHSWRAAVLYVSVAIEPFLYRKPIAIIP